VGGAGIRTIATKYRFVLASYRCGAGRARRPIARLEPGGPHWGGHEAATVGRGILSNPQPGGESPVSAYRQFLPGEPAPWFIQRSTSRPKFVFHIVGGRHVLLGFFGTAGDAGGQAALAFAEQHRSLFDDEHLAFFGVSIDPDDERTGRVRASLPGIRHLWDFDRAVSRLYGALPLAPEGTRFRRIWVLLNPGLQVVSVLPMQTDGSERAQLHQLLTTLPRVSHYAGMEMHAPVIVIPDALDGELCLRLTSEYAAHGGQASGFMRDIDGRTVQVHDPGHKSRADWTVEDPALKLLLQTQVLRKVVPMIRKACCFEASRMERYLVGCYDSVTWGHFAPHRDNTTRGTAHRRFALSVNLNADFEGGELCFPEYGTRRYKMPPGCAVVFSGSLLHAVTPVRSGRRYAFLPFLYDDAAAAIRQENRRFVVREGSESLQQPPG
jgi:predicted 2-oxoglutarate/Fe(II)-dependent dioxygenase YbiX/peroxiredoxin